MEDKAPGPVRRQSPSELYGSSYEWFVSSGACEILFSHNTSGSDTVRVYR